MIASKVRSYLPCKWDQVRRTSGTNPPCKWDRVHVLTSNFYRLHIVPACPAGRGPLDVKQSSYKKLSKFLEAAQKDGDLVQVKELTEDVESITAIRYDHDRIRFFRIDAEDKAESSTAGSALDSLPSDLGKYIPPIITRLYAVNAACSPLFAGTHP